MTLSRSHMFFFTPYAIKTGFVNRKASSYQLKSIHRFPLDCSAFTQAEHTKIKWLRPLQLLDMVLIVHQLETFCFYFRMNSDFMFASKLFDLFLLLEFQAFD